MCICIFIHVNIHIYTLVEISKCFSSVVNELCLLLNLNTYSNYLVENAVTLGI